MPTAVRAGASIHYEVLGDGPPLVLLEGLGYGPWMWRYQRPELGRSHRLILVDNRGIAPSTPLSAPYTIREFALDTLAVLDAEAVDRASLLGVSMGGFIAQTIAAIAPDRTDRLILVSTSAGGPDSAPMPSRTWTELSRVVPGESEAERLRRTMALALTPEFPTQRAEEFESILRDRLQAPLEPGQWAIQAAAGAGFDAHTEVSGLHVPSLVMAGTEDRVLPWTNSVGLFRALPMPQLLLFRGQNHLLFLERATEFNQEVRAFLEGPPATRAGIREVV